MDPPAVGSIAAANTPLDRDRARAARALPAHPGPAPAMPRDRSPNRSYVLARLDHGPVIGLDDETSRLIDPMQERALSDLREILLDGFLGSGPMAEIIDDQDAARRQSRPKMHELVIGRRIPIGIDPQQGDSFWDRARQGR